MKDDWHNLDSGNWKHYITIDQKLFEQNYNLSEEFKGGVDALFRLNANKTETEIEQKIIDYMKFTSL
jgi:hypothetical protein